jgi:hypothetical protein
LLSVARKADHRFDFCRAIRFLPNGKITSYPTLKIKNKAFAVFFILKARLAPYSSCYLFGLIIAWISCLTY